MSKFQDENTLWHDKINGSNNPGIYTAYAKILLPHTLNLGKISKYFSKCVTVKNGWKSVKVNRKPDMILPPLSLDEVIGWEFLDEYKYRMLRETYFTFCNLPEFRPKPLYKVNFIKAIKQLWNLRNKHRNAIWQNSGNEEAHQLAFRVMLAKKYYIQKKNNKKTSIIGYLAWYLDNLLIYLNKDIESKSALSMKNIKWLELVALGKKNTRLYKKLRKEKTIERYFGPDHDFSKAIKIYDKTC